MTVTQIAGVLPAIVFPVATLAQLVRVIRTRSAAEVSVATWLLFGFANLAIYVYAEHYTEWQAILGMLVTAALDFAIVVVALAAFRREDFVRPRAPRRPVAIPATPGPELAWEGFARTAQEAPAREACARK